MCTFYHQMSAVFSGHLLVYYLSNATNNSMSIKFDFCCSASGLPCSRLQISGLIFFSRRTKERKMRLLKLAMEMQEIKSRMQMQPQQNIGQIMLVVHLFPRDHNILLSITCPLWHQIHGGKLFCLLSNLIQSSLQCLLPRYKLIMRFQNYQDTDSIAVTNSRYIFCFSCDVVLQFFCSINSFGKLKPYAIRSFDVIFILWSKSTTHQRKKKKKKERSMKILMF